MATVDVLGIILGSTDAGNAADPYEAIKSLVSSASIGSAGDAERPLRTLRLPSFGTLHEDNELPVVLLRAAYQCDALQKKHRDTHGVPQTGSSSETRCKSLF